MLDRRTFLLGSLSGALATPRVGAAQQAGTVHQIGYLSPGSISSHGPLFRILLESLAELGYVEGRNIVVTYRWAQGSQDKLGTFADELVRLSPAIIITSGTPASHALKRATKEIPIVFLGVTDPVAAGLVEGLARPGANITGFSVVLAEIAGKRLELLRELVPRLHRVSLLWNPRNAGAAQAAREAEVAIRALDFEVLTLEVRQADEFTDAFARAARGSAAGLLVMEDPLVVVHRKTLAALAAEHRLPTIYGLKQFVEAGGLMSYGPSYRAMYRRAATVVDKILRGTSPADLPVQQPTEFELVLNLATARALGLTIPPSLLLRADQVIE